MSDFATCSEELSDGTLTSWIPFTTPGPTPDAICSSAIYQMPGVAETTLIAFDNWYTNIVGQGGVTCVPNEVIEWRAGAQSTGTVFSLGPFHCPSDYSTATTSAVDTVSTLVGCCPSDYDFQGLDLAAGCLSTLTSGALTVKSVYAPSGAWVSWDDLTISTPGVSVIGIQVAGYIFNSATPTLTSKTEVPEPSAASSTHSTVPTQTSIPTPTSSSDPSSALPSSDIEPTETTTVSASPISSQEPSLSPSTTPRPSSLTKTILTSISGATTTIFSTLHASPPPTSLNPSITALSTPTSSPALSLGAEIGIGLGAGAILIALCFLIAFLLIRHRHQTINSQNASDEKHSGGRAELEGSSEQSMFWVGMMRRGRSAGGNGGGPHELEGKVERLEGG